MTAFNDSKFSKLDNSFSQTTQQVFSYVDTTSTVGVITASGYFNDKAAVFKLYDLMFIQGSDADALMKVSSATGATPVTLTAFITDTIGNLSVTGNIVLGDAGTDTITFTGKQVGTLYRNETSSAVMSLKMHNHLTTASMNAEFKTETANTSGAFYGIYNEAFINATGTGSVTASLNAAVVSSTFTVTGGTIIGCYGQARADGTVAGNSFMAGLYGLIEASSAITANHVCACWLDTHQAAAVTGSYQMLYMTENGVTPLDQVFYMRTPGAVAFAEFDTCSAFISSTAETGGTAKKIKITIDGVVHYINAYTG